MQRLAGVAVAGHLDLVGRGLPVAVGLDDDRRVVAELEPDRLRAARARIAHPTSGEPVKVMKATSGWSTMALPTVPPPPVTTLSCSAGRPHSSMSRSARAMAEKRRLARRLQHDGAPRGDGRRQLVGHEVEREVERADGAHDSDRQAEREAELALPRGRRVERHHLAGQLAGLGGRELERAHGPLGLDPRRLDRLGRLVGDRAAELLGPLGEEGGGPVEDLGPLPRRERAFVQRGLGGGDGPLDVGRGAGRHGPDDGAVVGRVHLDDVVGGEALASER